MQELRIVSGYHRGATLPLAGEALSIGSHEDADVVLADPGVAEFHAQLLRQGQAWVLEPAEDEVRGAEDNLAQSQVVLGDGVFARVGPVWLTVCAAGQPWQDPPPVPVDVPAAPQGDDPAPADAGAGMEAGAETGAQAGAEDGVEAGAAAPGDAAPPSRPEAAPGGRARRWRLLLVPVAAVAALSAAAAFALTTRPVTAGAASKPHASDLMGATERATAQATARAAPGLAPAAPARLSPADLQAALRARLGEVDLLSRVTLELNEREWEIRGALNEEETERLQRMLRAFVKRHAIDFPVNVRIGGPESLLPFHIAQVMSGSAPSIITDDGQQLYVGDEYRGVRLAAVSGNRLRFTGKQDLEIAW